MFCEICQKNFNSSPSFYRHRLYNQKHLVLEQIMVFEAEIKELAED